MPMYFVQFPYFAPQNPKTPQFIGLYFNTLI